MTTAVTRPRYPRSPRRLAFGALALALCVVPFASGAAVTADFDLTFSSSIVVDKGGLSDAGTFSPQTLVLQFQGQTGSVRTATIEGFSIPQTEGAVREHFQFRFETSPGVFEETRDVELYWDVATGHAVSEIFKVRTSFVSLSQVLTSADYELFLTTDETGAAFGDDPLPTFCGTNVLQMPLGGEPFSDFDSGDARLIAVGCPIDDQVQMGNYGTTVSLVASVPEPSAWLLQLSAVGTLGMLVRRRPAVRL